MKILMCFILICLAACGKSGGTAMDPINKQWTNSTLGYEYDFTKTKIGNASQFETTLGDGSCTCTIALTGDGTNGDFQISGCSPATGKTPSIDCSTLAWDGTYTVASAELSMCNNGSCATYR